MIKGNLEPVAAGSYGLEAEMLGAEESMSIVGGREDSEARVRAERITRLIEGFRSHDPGTRMGSRRSLEEIGTPAVPFLVQALDDPDWHVRWDTIKTLAYIADPSAAPALANAMSDYRFGIRWLAASAMIQLGPQGLPALLEGLIRHGDSVVFRTGARRVLTEVIEQGIAPDLKLMLQRLLEALEGGPTMDTPLVARETLDLLAA